MTQQSTVSVINEKQGFAKYMQRFGFGASDMACNFIWQVLTIYIMMYYTDIAHIPVFAVSFLFLFARIIDGFTDVLMGMIIDKTRTRWGKSRPWFLFAAVPFGLLSILCFAVPASWGVSARIFYVYVTYMGISIAYTMVNAPISSSLPALTADKNERNVLVSYRMVMSSIGSLLITALVAPLVAAIGGGNEQLGVFWTMTIFSVVGTLLFFFTFATIEEVVPPVEEDAPAFKQAFGSISKNGHLWIFLTNMCLMWASYFLLSGVMLYFFAYVVHSPLLMFIAPLTLTVMQIIAASASPAITNNVFPKKKHSFMAASAIFVVGLAVIFAMVWTVAGTETTGVGYLVDASGNWTSTEVTLVADTPAGAASVWLLFVGIVIAGFGHGWRVTVYYAMMPEPMDYGEWQSGINTSGITASLTGFFCKFILALAGALPTFLFGFTNYYADVRLLDSGDIGSLVGTSADGAESAATSAIQQSNGTFWVLMTCFIILPLIITIISYLIVQFFWSIDDEIDAVREDLNNGLTQNNGNAKAFIDTLRAGRKSKEVSSEEEIAKYAKDTIDLIGKENIIKISSCATKVRITVHDGSIYGEKEAEKAKKIGYFGVVLTEERPNYVQLISGVKAKEIAKKMKESF